MKHETGSLSPRQLDALRAALHEGSAEASDALARWIEKPWVVEIDTLEQLPLDEVISVLGSGDEAICFCSAQMQGPLSGAFILAFDDRSGLMLADLVLGRAAGTTSEWNELAVSAAMETTNIVACCYMNCLSRTLLSLQESSVLLPSPPQFSRDFAASLMQFAVAEQALLGDRVLLARTRFEMQATPVMWTMLFVPDAASMQRLAEWLPDQQDEGEEGVV